MATRFDKTAQTEKLGVDFVRRTANEAGSIFRPFDTADIGIDGALEFVDAQREPTGDLALVQIKSGTSYIKKGKFVLLADRDHFETWARYAVPVVGIVYDPTTSTARWVDVSEHLRKHPDRIEQGPYIVEAPASQPFTSASFPDFARQFVRKRGSGTRLDATPNFLVRKWRLSDAKPTRALLSSIAPDYPDFYGWLERQWAKSEVSKKVVAIGSSIAAYSMWTRKDERNVKLQTLIVGQAFRGTSIGPHLLYHEIRTWAADPKIERVFVTVASNKADLIGYFGQFGFRLEGISGNRYPRASGAAELVLGKHFIREVIRDGAGVRRLADILARRVWGTAPSGSSATRFGVDAASLSIPAAFPDVRVEADEAEGTVSPRIALVSSGGQLRGHDDSSLMREFYPLRIHLPRKLYVIVPIYAPWVQAMLATTTNATPGSPTTLKLRVDNVYYCYPKLPALAAGDQVIFYEPALDGGSRSAIGCAVVREATVDTPKALYARFGDRGVYTEAEIRAHARNGKAMAIHFDLFEPFSTPIPLDEIRLILNNKTNVQGLTKIGRDPFERIRDRGLS